MPLSSFRALCTGEKVNEDGERLCYIGTVFSRVVAPEFIIQGGLIETRKDSQGLQDSKTSNSADGQERHENKPIIADVGQTIYGGPFELENVTEINQKGLVCLAHPASDTNKNGSQFFVTLQDGLKIHENFPSTVVGKVVKGLEVLELLQDVKVDENDEPMVGDTVTIVRCGELELKNKKKKKTKAATAKDNEPESSKQDNESNLKKLSLTEPEPTTAETVENPKPSIDSQNNNNVSSKSFTESRNEYDDKRSYRRYHRNQELNDEEAKFGFSFREEQKYRHLNKNRSRSPPRRRSRPGITSYQDSEGEVIVKGRGSRKYREDTTADSRRYKSTRNHESMRYHRNDNYRYRGDRRYDDRYDRYDDNSRNRSSDSGRLR